MNFVEKTKVTQGGKERKYLLYLVLGLGISILLLYSDISPIFIVSSGERGVVISKISGTQLESFGEGLHFKTPIIDSAKILEVRTRKHEVEASSASKDLQLVHALIAVNYHVEPDSAYLLYQKIGTDYEARVIDPLVQEVVKEVTAKFIAEDLITKREEVGTQIKERLKQKLSEYYLVLDDFSIKNFDFSEEFNKAIESKVTAEQTALKEKNNLEVVKFQAQQKVAQAEGDAEAIKIINEQLQKSPRYIDFITIQKWNGVMPLALGSNNLLSITPSSSQNQEVIKNV